MVRSSAGATILLLIGNDTLDQLIGWLVGHLADELREPQLASISWAANPTSQRRSQRRSRQSRASSGTSRSVGRAEPGRAEHSRGEQSRAGQSRASRSVGDTSRQGRRRKYFKKSCARSHASTQISCQGHWSHRKATARGTNNICDSIIGTNTETIQRQINQMQTDSRR